MSIQQRFHEPFDEFLSQFTKPVPARLFHYTTPAGLLGIIQSSTLWATNIRFLNDAHEYRHGLRQIVFQLQKRKETDKPQESILERIIQSMDSVHEESPYVFCLSTEGDQLGQWRAYCASSGFSIEFDPASLHLSYSYGNAEKPNSILTRVEYDPRVQSEVCEQLLVQTLPRLLTRIQERLQTGAPLEASGDEGIILLWSLASFLGAAVKHESFQEEREWRLLALNAHSQVRTRNDQLIPYCVLSPGNGRLPIKSVIVGPQRYPDLALEAVKTLLSNHGYAAVGVTVSSTPWREM